MAESDIPPLKVPIILDFSGLPEQLNQLGQESERMGERGSAGFRVLGFASAKLSEELGVPFRAAHILGTRVEEMAKSTLPAWGMAFGAVGVAVAATTMTLSYLTEQKRKQAEMTEREIQQLTAEVGILYKDTEATEEYNRALYNSAISKRELLQLDLVKKYQDEEEKLKKLNKEAEDGPGAWFRLKTVIEELVGIESRRDVDVFGEKQNEARMKANALRDDLAKLYQDILKYNKTPAFLDVFGAKSADTDPGKYDDNQAKVDAILQESINHRYLIGLEGDEREEMQMRLAQQKQLEQLEEFGATKEEIAMVTATHAMEWRQRESDFLKKKGEEDLRNQQKIDEMELQNRAAVLGQSAALMDSAYQLSHGKYKAFFYISRAAAAAEAIIQGHLGASKAVGTFWGMEMAPVLIGMGYANAALIAAQTFEGGGSGTTSVPTYSASPVTGLPSYPQAPAQASAPPNIYISIDGGKTYDRMEITKDVVRTLYDNNGSVGGLSVSVERSA